MTRFETRLQRLWHRRRQARLRLASRALGLGFATLAMVFVVVAPGLPSIQELVPALSTMHVPADTDRLTQVQPTSGFAGLIEGLVGSAGANTVIASEQDSHVDIVVVGSNSEDALTVDEAVELALTSNPELEAAEASMEQAEAGLALANQALAVAQTQMGLVDPTDPAALQEAALAELEAQFAVIDATGGVTLANSAVDYAEALISHTVRASFYGLLQASDLLAVARRALEQANEQLEQAELQYNVGVVARRDVVAAESQVAEMEANVAAAEKGLQLVGLALNRLLGRGQLTHDLRVVRDNRPVPEVDTGHDEQVATLDDALEYRMDIVQQKIGSQGAQQKLAILGAVSDPTMAAMLEHQVELISAQQAEAEAKLDSARAQAEYDVRSIYLEADELQKRYDLAQKNHDYSEDLLRLARLRFENGLSTALEVNAAHTGLMKSEAELVQARYALILIESKLALAARGPLSMSGTTGGTADEVRTHP